ncbi:MAG: Asp23/Gls24 family envelope stress response protein [Lentisphaeria bacterium]|nr:Asp23/Gls24 family envelope stress response protein [Lentisphaeria bacterium]
MKTDYADKKLPEKQDTMVLDDTELGDIKIHEGVIASLARKAALSVDGVSRLSGNSLVDNLAEMVGSRRIQSRAVTISLGEKNNVSIELKIIIKFGYCIPEVANAVQKAVISDVEATTGMNVTSVDVLVQEVEEESKDEEVEEPTLPLD